MQGKMNNLVSHGKSVTVLIAMLIFMSNVVKAQDIRSIVFAEADNTMSAALNVNADVLAPKAFAKGTDLYYKAEMDFKNNKPIIDVQKRLKLAAKEFRNSQKAINIAVTVFGTTIQARNDAIVSEAENYGGQAWFDAEKVFKKAAIQLEEGDLSNAKNNGKEAESLYRKAELKAIKANLLDEAYKNIKEAEAMKASEYAPKTLAKAKVLVKDAEKALNENRYDTDEARVTARQAKREARHAVYLTGLALRIKDNKLTSEDILLASETPLKRIAGSAGVNITFESGFKRSTDEIVGKIEDQKMALDKSKVDLNYTKQRLSLFMAENQDLKNQLGQAYVQNSTLSEQIAAQEKTRKLFEQVESLFTPDEALIFRENNNLRIRLTGLTFAVGDARINPSYYAFLGKVSKAIQLFSNADVMIEGHTDSFGSDATNLKLSIDRANAVKDYLAANSTLEAGKLSAIGYGESRPIATNETEEGRAKNRRIAVVIQPSVETSF